MIKQHILLIDADQSFLNSTRRSLDALGYDVTLAHTEAALENALERERFELAVCGAPEGRLSEFDVMSMLKGQSPDLPVILITRGGSIEGAVQAMREGAIDYLAKPFDIDMLRDLITSHLQSRHPASTVVAEAESSVQLLQLARRVAARDVSVLISGESGTGKEVLARYIHTHSHRNDQPFVAINCAAIPENMLEAVLFGYEKGAFTGAFASNPGKFEQAHGGTLLLDEISEMDIGLQAKLLRVLQEREVERIGGRKTIPLDVRVLATTNRNLQLEVREGRFREDLFYRLNVFPMRLLPLRKRKEDILPLAEQLIISHSDNGQIPRLNRDARERLTDYNWPGNIRELGNVIQRALVLCNGSEIQTEDLHFETDYLDQMALEVDDRKNLTSNLKSHEYDLIIQALKEGNGSRKDAATKLGISPRTLRYKLARMREMGMDVPLAG